MKLISFALMALCMVAISTIGVAKGADSTSLNIVRKDSSDVYVANYAGSRLGKVLLTIKDTNQKILVRRYLGNQKDFTIPINFSSVPEGIYYLEIDNGTSKQTARIDYNNRTAATYYRVADIGEDRYVFLASHVGSEEIYIRIYDVNNNVVFNEKRLIQGNFSMLFNLKNVTGEPSFEVVGVSGNSLIVLGHPIKEVQIK